ncbi:mandelate racemase/muconate lactonizing enzyme family protein [Roseomonas vastitatis]|uniref:glucarate dehydratase n=2 Tax=Teichococcus vastitatis TaxID=2307076 RepID=A0ABS9W617_9PROT|nr:mandelate racemase/muconate lactonizing enzyme family protein [Pseudoroseomonas vastitatis]MCI0754731.1 mandelate racemase/muconate lactonizing enzyme family protein [Pseudoroseomonas vastitatis]
MSCDTGWRIFSFLKITTADGIVGWSEYNESFGSAGLTQVIEALAPLVIGMDPRRIELITRTLHAKTVQSRGGLNRQAIAAIENALLDIKGKALGVPVCDLLGGAVRDRIPVYWSHCGSYRARFPEALTGVPQVRSYDDLSRLGEEVRRRGFHALKTNTLLPDEKGGMRSHRPGFGFGTGYPELNWNPQVVRGAHDTAMALRQGAGPDVGVMLDVNFHFKTEGVIRIAEALAPVGLAWLEVDTHDAPSLALIRHAASCPVASGETLCERRDFKPFFESYAMDVAIVDVVWNGWWESLKIAAMADVYEVNVAPHNFYGHLASAMSAYFCAAIPNFRIMETDIDSVAWRDDLVSAPLVIENGEMLLPAGPGWGIEVDEAAVRARPPTG